MGQPIIAGSLVAPRLSHFPDIVTMLEDVKRAEDAMLLAHRTVYVLRKAQRRAIALSFLKGRFTAQLPLSMENPQ